MAKDRFNFPPDIYIMNSATQDYSLITSNPFCEYVKDKTLNCQGMRDLPFIYFNDFILSNPGITDFNFSDCGLTGIGINDTYIVYGLSLKENDFSLNLSDNPLSSIGLMALIESLIKYDTIHSITGLNLEKCNLDSDMALTVLKKFLAHTTKKFIELNLVGNNIINKVSELTEIWKLNIWDENIIFSNETLQGHLVRINNKKFSLFEDVPLVDTHVLNSAIKDEIKFIKERSLSNLSNDSEPEYGSSFNTNSLRNSIISIGSIEIIELGVDE